MQCGMKQKNERCDYGSFYILLGPNKSTYKFKLQTQRAKYI